MWFSITVIQGCFYVFMTTMNFSIVCWLTYSLWPQEPNKELVPLLFLFVAQFHRNKKKKKNFSYCLVIVSKKKKKGPYPFVTTKS